MAWVFRLSMEKDKQNLDEEKIKDLVALAKDGDQEAFSLIYQRFYTPIYRFVFYQVKHKEEAEDLAQNVFLKVMKALPGFEDRGVKFSSWMYTIARNSVIDFWKKKKDIVFGEGETLELIAGGTNNVSKAISQSETKGVLKEIVLELSPDQREVVTLFFIEELTYPEISKITGKKEDAIRALKYRALKSLKNKINKIPDIDEL